MSARIDHLRRIVAFEYDLTPFHGAVLGIDRSPRLRAHEDLAGGRGGLQSGGKVHDASDGREVSMRVAELTERRQAAADADPHPKLGRVKPVSSELTPALLRAACLDIACDCQRLLRMVGMTDRKVEDCENGIADDLVQQPILPPYGLGAFV